ncbi:hypothetical protein AHMF7616_01874 [Adhaeribacter pallidiroseus]|uniref:Uncharacterized protein n=2 Tax=Adhaeribacter pallidiroseus TaxID=2072847 RepID=A0A369QFR8_9BACT|nr:hypothetical protein AHMF7616_01874 [Adhaeribacter pallidiroseus]
MPTEWQELTEKQVYELLPFVYADRHNPEVRSALLKVLFPIPKAIFRRMDAFDVFRLQEQCLWVWDKPVDQKAIGEFSFNQVQYILPESDFSNLTIIEYGMADHYFRAFSRQNPDTQAINFLVATLCRPQAKKLNVNDPEWNGDRREKYNSKIAERRAQEFGPLDILTKIIVLQRFIQGQKVIHSSYREIFEESKTKSSAAVQGPNLGWIGVIDDLAETGTFGDWEKTAFTALHTILFHLRKKFYQRKELEQNS